MKHLFCKLLVGLRNSRTGEDPSPELHTAAGGQRFGTGLPCIGDGGVGGGTDPAAANELSTRRRLAPRSFRTPCSQHLSKP